MPPFAGCEALLNDTLGAPLGKQSTRVMGQLFKRRSPTLARAPGCPEAPRGAPICAPFCTPGPVRERHRSVWASADPAR